MLRAPTAFRERTFLDIGAGEGAISRELIRLGVPPSSITCIEKRPECRPALEALGVGVNHAVSFAVISGH
jgi:phospholipid N-methyltransferase